MLVSFDNPKLLLEFIQVHSNIVKLRCRGENGLLSFFSQKEPIFPAASSKMAANLPGQKPAGSPHWNDCLGNNPNPARREPEKNKESVMDKERNTLAGMAAYYETNITGHALPAGYLVITGKNTNTDDLSRAPGL